MTSGISGSLQISPRGVNPGKRGDIRAPTFWAFVMLSIIHCPIIQRPPPPPLRNEYTPLICPFVCDRIKMGLGTKIDLTTQQQILRSKIKRMRESGLRKLPKGI